VFLAKWNHVKKKYCEEGLRRRKEEMRKRKDVQEQEAYRNNKASEERLQKPGMVVTFIAHFLLRNETNSPSQYQHFTIEFATPRKLTLEQIADKVKRMRENHNKKMHGEGFVALDDKWKHVDQLYIEGNEKPIFDRADINSDGNALMYSKLKDGDALLHIYTYNPNDESLQVQKTTERMAQFFIHAKENCYVFYDKFYLKYSEVKDLSVGELISSRLGYAALLYGYNDRFSLFNAGNKYYFSTSTNGTQDMLFQTGEKRKKLVFNDQGDVIAKLLDDPSYDSGITFKEKIAMFEGVKDQDPIIIYNFHPRIPQTWML